MSHLGFLLPGVCVLQNLELGLPGSGGLVYLHKCMLTSEGHQVWLCRLCIAQWYWAEEGKLGLSKDPQTWKCGWIRVRGRGWEMGSEKERGSDFVGSSGPC